MINVTDLKSSWGSYFIDGGQGVKDVMKAFLVPSTTDLEWAGRILPTTDTQVRKMKSTLSSVLQPWQKGASPTGDLTINPLPRDLSFLKYETDIDPDTIAASYAGFLDSDTNDRKQWPISKWIVNEMFEKGNEDWELSAVVKGVYSAPTPGTGGAPSTSHNGLAKQITDDITAEKITPVSGPTNWSTDPETFCTEIETFIEDASAVSEIRRHIIENKCDKFFMSKTLANRLAKGLHAKYNINYNATGENLLTAPMKFMLPFTNLMVVGLPSMNGLKRVILTPPQNRFGYVKRPNSQKVAQLFETGPRELLAFSDFYKQVSYWDPAYVICNDQA